MQNISFFIRCREHLDTDPEETFTLYGEAHEFEYMWELSHILSEIHPSWLVEFGHYEYSKSGTVSEVYFAGEEIHPDDQGNFWKFTDDAVYILKDAPDGMYWDFRHKCANL